MALGQLLKRILPVALASKAAANELVAAVDASTTSVANIANLGGVLLSTQAEIDRVADLSANVVTVTTATLALTLATHASKTVLLDSTHTQTITLPAATGTLATFRLVVGTKGTDGSKIIQVANATDILQGVSLVAQTDTTQVSGFATTATDDTVTLNNSTKGGFVGDEVYIKDIKTGVFQVRVVGNATGTVVTPFSAGV